MPGGSQMAPPTAETVPPLLMLLFAPGIHASMLPLGIISLSRAEKPDLDGGMLIHGCFPQFTRALLSWRGLAEVISGPGDMLSGVGRHFSCPSSLQNMTPTPNLYLISPCLSPLPKPTHPTCF